MHLLKWKILLFLYLLQLFNLWHISDVEPHLVDAPNSMKRVVP
jgi:hypothetical protein